MVAQNNVLFNIYLVFCFNNRYDLKERGS